MIFFNKNLQLQPCSHYFLSSSEKQISTANYCNQACSVKCGVRVNVGHLAKHIAAHITSQLYTVPVTTLKYVTISSYRAYLSKL